MVNKTSILTTYWDDGNTLSGDGWSSLWTIESNYEWNGGSPTTKDICIKISIQPSATAAATSSATQAAAGVGMGVSVGSSLLSMSSPIAIFIMINQFQMLLLLPLAGSYLSNEVLYTITGMSMTLLNFSFLRLEKINVISYLFEYLSIDQLNNNLLEIGIMSGNSLINWFKLFLLFIFLITIHLLFIPIFLKWK